MANIFKRRKKQNEDSQTTDADLRKKDEEEDMILPPVFSRGKIAKHVLGGIAVVGCVVLGVLAMLAGFLLPAFVAASLAIGLGGIAVKEAVDDYKTHQDAKAKYNSAKAAKLKEKLDAEKEKEKELDEKIEKINDLESAKQEAKATLEGTKAETFGNKGGNALAGDDLKAYKIRTKDALTETVKNTFGDSGVSM